MEQVEEAEDQFCCSICLDPLKDPVSLPCGHNYCSGCIEGYWNDQKERFSCPQCRETFVPRPILKKNTMLADMMGSLKKTRLQGVPPDLCYAGPGDVACDSCTGRQRKAVKTCLQCLVSYCDVHLQPHYQSPAFKSHNLLDASRELQEKVRSNHDEVKRLFIRSDEQCIGYLRSMEEDDGQHSPTDDRIRLLVHCTILPAAGESEQPVSSDVHPLADHRQRKVPSSLARSLLSGDYPPSNFGYVEKILRGVTAFFKMMYFLFLLLYYSKGYRETADRGSRSQRQRGKRNRLKWQQAQ